MKSLVLTLISWGPFGLLVLAILDSVGVPLVGAVDALLITLSTISPAQAYLGATCAIIGSVAGSLILFTIARKGGHVLLARHTAHGKGARLRAWFERYGLLTVFIPAVSPLPMPLKIPVFCAGALEVRTSTFVIVVAVARTLRYLCLAYLGQHYGKQTLPFLRSHLAIVITVVAALTLVAILLMRFMSAEPIVAKET